MELWSAVQERSLSVGVATLLNKKAAGASDTPTVLNKDTSLFRLGHVFHEIIDEPLASFH